MRKAVCCLLVMLFVCALLPMRPLAADAPYRIAVSDACTPQERYAAETLQRYLYRITGTQPLLTDDASDADFAVGTAWFDRDDLSDLPNGGYRIVKKGGTVGICGGGMRGTLNGVYAFLRDHCGCRWYSAEVTVIPTARTLTLPETIDKTYTPYFEYTETDWPDAFDTEYALANALSGGYGKSMTTEQGGNVQYVYGFCHTLSTLFCARDTYFDAHPEYFALHDGKRSPNQLCLTNPDTLRIVIGEALDVLQSRHDPDADIQILSVTQDDNSDYCECAACKTLDDANGSHAGTMVTFANAVADAVKAAGYDNVLIDTFAYQYTRKAPTQVVPRDNVVIRLCSIECCFCHMLDDDGCRENRAFMQDLRDWHAICDRIYIRDYTTNYWETVCIYPDFGVLQRNVQIFYENNVRGLFEEGNASSAIHAEFGELRCYLLARLMQDPYLDYDAEMRGFLAAYYGAAAEPIYGFLTRTMEKAGASRIDHLGTFPDSTKTLTRFTAKDVRDCDAFWHQAEENTAGTAYYERVERAHLSWRFWKCENYRSEFSPLRHLLFARWQAKETLYNDMVRLGIRKINDTRRLRELTQCRALILLRPAGKWCALYEGKFWDAITPAVEWIYRFFAQTKL